MIHDSTELEYGFYLGCEVTGNQGLSEVEQRRSITPRPGRRPRSWPQRRPEGGRRVHQSWAEVVMIAR